MFNETENLQARASSTASSRRTAPRPTPPPGSTGRTTTSRLPADRLELAVKLEAERMARLVLREPQVDEREGGRRQRAPLPRRRRRRGRGQRAPLQDGVHAAPLPLADHRLDGGHPGLHARGLRGLLPDVLRAEQRDRRRRRRRARARPARAIRDAYGAHPARSRSRPRTSSPEPPQLERARARAAQADGDREAARRASRAPRSATPTTRR